MTIEAAVDTLIQRRLALEEALFAAITAFERDTKCSVERIDLEHIERGVAFEQSPVRTVMELRAVVRL